MKAKFTLKIEGLFGQFDYKIVLDEQYKFLTGLNGSGKTTILNILDALSKQNLCFFKDIPFSLIKYEDENTYIHLEKEDNKISLKNKNKKSIWEVAISELNEIEKDESLGLHYIKIADVYVDYFDNKKIFSRNDLYIKSDRGRLFFEKCPRIKYNMFHIGDFRLIKIGGIHYLHKKTTNEITVEDLFDETIFLYSELLKEILNKTLSDNAKIANSLDRSFPQRLLESTKSGKKISKKEFDRRLKKIQLFQDKFVHYFNQGQVSNALAEFNEETAATLYVYMNDMEEKQEGYRDIIEKLDLFVSAIQSKHFANKEMNIDSENGIMFKTIDGNNTNIKPTDLSSGEKQEVILLYDLLFNMQEDTVLLIDEPETSFHVAWAKAFMNDMEKILKLKKCQALIATHSPFIIGERWDHAIDLTKMAESWKRG